MHITPTTIAAGEAALDRYAAAAVCGPDADLYPSGMARETGLGVIAGVLLACIDRGIDEEPDMVAAAARVSRCRRSTVTDVLDALTGDDPERHLFETRGDGVYRPLPDARPRALLTA